MSIIKRIERRGWVGLGWVELNWLQWQVLNGRRVVAMFSF